MKAAVAAVALLLISSASATGFRAFSVNNPDNVVVYWGQNSAGIQYGSQQNLWEQDISFYCQDTTYDIINIAFLNIFFDTSSARQLPSINLANHCSATFANYPNLLNCPSIGAGIQTCQQNNKKVLLSLGGAAGVYGFSSAAQATTFATTVWNMFLGGTDSSYPRPFGSVALDGVDFDIEGGSSQYYATFAQALKTLYGTGSKTYYMSAAPQCPYPDAYVGPLGSTLLATVALDWVNVQFYNNYCSVSSGSNFNYDTWNTWAAGAPNTNVKIMVGVPAAPYSGAGFLTFAQLSTALTAKQTSSNFGGVMLWDAGSAYVNSNYGGQISAWLKNAPIVTPPKPTPTPTANTGGSTAPPTQPPTTPPTAPPAGTQAPTSCGSSVNGYLCVAECTAQFYYCAAGQAYPAQSTAPGTVCSNGQQVYSYQCTPSSTSAPTQAGATTPPPTNPPTTAPTMAPNHGQTPSAPTPCATANSINCYPTDCCNQFYQCANGVAYPPQSVAYGTLCSNHNIVFSNDASCASVTCGANLPVNTPPPAPTCGDHLCQAGETCTSCASDCGACPASCGDNKCNGAETCSSCPTDCGVCQSSSPGAGPSATAPPATTPTAVPTTGSGATVSPPVAPSSSGQKLIGYYTNWAQYRNAPAKFFPENINAKLFTHLVYGFAKIDGNFNVQPFEWNDILDYTDGMYKRFDTTVRAQNPLIKTSISIGGWNFNADASTAYIFPTIASTSANSAIFINSAIAFARANSFDGIDIDWEYPADTAQGGSAVDKANFARMLRQFRAAITFESQSTGRPPLLLSIAVAAGLTNIANGYDIANIHPYVDWIGVMTYDLHGSWETQTGSATALYSSTDTLSVDAAVNAWLAAAPASKLVVGLATYGRSWTLASAANHGMGASAPSPGTAGTYTAAAGFLAFYEISTMVAAGASVVYDAPSHTYYAYSGTQWVSYDNTSSLQEKVAYVKTKLLAGVMFWALDLDDFNQGYPLISSVAQAMFVPSSTSFSVKVAASSTAAFNANTLKSSIASTANVDVNSIQIGAVTTNSDGTLSVSIYFTNTFTSSQSANDAYAAAVAAGCNTPGVVDVNGQACAAATPTATAAPMMPSMLGMFASAVLGYFML